MVLTRWAVGKFLWGDKALQALQFADDPNPHSHPVAGDLDINTIIDAIQNTSTGHHHDGTDSRTLYSVLDPRYWLLSPAGQQHFLGPSSPLANDTPSLLVEDANAGPGVGGEGPSSAPVAMRFHSGSAGSEGAIDLLPAVPGIQMWADSSFAFYFGLLAYGIKDLNQGFNALAIDVNNFVGHGAGALIWADDGSFGGSVAGDNWFLTPTHAPNVDAANYYGTTISQVADPTNTQIPTGKFMLVKNTTSGSFKLWGNDGGTMKSVALA